MKTIQPMLSMQPYKLKLDEKYFNHVDLVQENGY
jgi:hypothetical protein